MTRSSIAMAAATLLALTACHSPGEPEPMPAPSPTPPAAAPATTAPIPYTAEQIRGAHPNGTLLRYRITQPNGVVVQCMRFVDGDDERVTVESWMEDESGQQLRPPVKQSNAWTELRDHAAFELANTSRERSRVTVPSGSYDCWHYTVTEDDKVPSVSHFHFADSKPGPPVLMTAGTDGDELVRMELLEYRPGG